MKFTKEQFEELGKFYIDDFPINDSDQDLMLKVFNSLPYEQQGLAISWGLNDTVFRDNVFEYMCETQLGMSVDEYYKSEIYEEYHKDRKFIDIDFEKFK